MTSVTFDSPWINWVAIIYESDDIVIAEIDLNADGKHKQPAAYLTDESNFFIYFNSGTVKFYDLPFTIPLAFAEQGTNIGTTLGGARLGAMAGSAFGPVGTVVGAGLGALTPTALQLFGSNVQRQAAEQEQAGKPIDISAGKAAAATALQAPLDRKSTRLNSSHT